ncbi:SGNH/GDSL hydrolase family protein [Microbacterium arborescens]
MSLTREEIATPSYTPQTYSFETPAPTPPSHFLPANPSVLVIGDSFTQGYGAAVEKEQGYAYLLGPMIGASDVRVDGKGGTGFVNENDYDNITYVKRIRLAADAGNQPDLVIFQGGLNDVEAGDENRDGLQAAVAETLAVTRERFPSAQIAIVGPIGYRTFSDVNSAYREAARAADAIFIPGDGWSTWLPQRDDLYSEDGWHPSTLGHQRIAEGLAKTLQEHFAFG